jgi:hypothetical protein
MHCVLVVQSRNDCCKKNRDICFMLLYLHRAAFPPPYILAAFNKDLPHHPFTTPAHPPYISCPLWICNTYKKAIMPVYANCTVQTLSSSPLTAHNAVHVLEPMVIVNESVLTSYFIKINSRTKRLRRYLPQVDTPRTFINVIHIPTQKKRNADKIYRVVRASCC